MSVSRQLLECCACPSEQVGDSNTAGRNYTTEAGSYRVLVSLPSASGRVGRLNVIGINLVVQLDGSLQWNLPPESSQYGTLKGTFSSPFSCSETSGPEQFRQVADRFCFIQQVQAGKDFRRRRFGQRRRGAVVELLADVFHCHAPEGPAVGAVRLLS